MSAAPRDTGDSGEVPGREDPPRRARDAWNPRRSLGARLVLILVPVAVVPALAYWVAVDAEQGRAEERLSDAFLVEARAREERGLREEAGDAARSIADTAQNLADIARRAGAEAARALALGPDPARPAEALRDDPGGHLHTAETGVSVGLVSRKVGPTREARRDLAATQRLEPSFVTLSLGPVDVSAVAVVTASGVLRIVPGRPLVVAGKPVVPPDFGFPSKEMRALAEGPAPDGPEPVAWTPSYEDLYSGTGQIITASVLVRNAARRPVAEVQVDWAFGRLFSEPPDPLRPSDVELLVGPDGGVLRATPRRLAAADLSALASAVKAHGPGTFVATLGGRRYLAVVHVLPGLPWTYAKATPREALELRVKEQLDPIFALTRRRRAQLRLLYVAVVVALSVGLVAITGRALAPVRRVARAADSLASGRPLTDLPDLDREDEAGRLSRAMREADRRVRWRMASMEGVHRLAQTAALMTRPDETLAQLARQIGQLVGATKAWLVLWDPETRSLVGAPPGWGIPEGVLEGVRATLDEPTLAINVYRTGEAAWGNDLSDPRLSKTFLKLLDVRQNYVLAPLRAESGSLGVLGIADKPGGFDDEDRSAIEGYADQAALLLRNARLYEELQKSYEKLRDAQRNRDYFLQNVNHELRTPLTAILGWSEVLVEDRPDKETVRIAVDQINRSAQFLLALISDLLDLSRFEEGRTRLEPEDVDLGALVAGAVEPVSVMAEAKGIEMTVETPGEPAVVRLDPMRMRQVLWNLVHNAVKFTPKGGKIRVSASADAAGASFSVVDNGVGVDAKDLPFIFERFRQADGSATRAYRGMGIGLALARAYVELHGGTITVDSQPGRGTAFHVRIPRTGAPPPGTRPASPA